MRLWIGNFQTLAWAISSHRDAIDNCNCTSEYEVALKHILVFAQYLSFVLIITHWFLFWI